VIFNHQIGVRFPVAPPFVFNPKYNMKNPFKKKSFSSILATFNTALTDLNNLVTVNDETVKAKKLAQDKIAGEITVLTNETADAKKVIGNIEKNILGK
jgi:hypothetical protein